MKVLLVATVQSHICQFHRPLAKMLHEHGAELHVAARNNLAEKNGMVLDFAEKVFDIPFSRSPKSKDNITAYRQLKRIIDEGHYDVVHCNTPMGGIVARLAARKARKRGTKVFYTAHGFHFYKGAPLLNWLVYYPIEKWFARHYTDALILISTADYDLAIEKKFCANTYRIHSVGISSDKYHIFTNEQKLQQRQQLNLAPDDFICVCTGELNQNKNQAAIIRCIPQILKNIPHFQLLLAGNGPQKDSLQALIDDLGIADHVQLLGYKTNLPDYVCVADIAVSASIREGLGINLIEAQLCERPVIGSDNRGHREFIVSNVNGYLVSLDAINEQFPRCVFELYFSKETYQNLAVAGRRSALKYLDLSVERELENIYFINSRQYDER